jgi:hypothetical protein
MNGPDWTKIKINPITWILHELQLLVINIVVLSLPICTYSSLHTKGISANIL